MILHFKIYEFWLLAWKDLFILIFNALSRQRYSLKEIDHISHWMDR